MALRKLRRRKFLRIYALEPLFYSFFIGIFSMKPLNMELIWLHFVARWSKRFPLEIVPIFSSALTNSQKFFKLNMTSFEKKSFYARSRYYKKKLLFKFHVLIIK